MASDIGKELDGLSLVELRDRLIKEQLRQEELEKQNKALLKERSKLRLLACLSNILMEIGLTASLLLAMMFFFIATPFGWILIGLSFLVAYGL